MHRRNVRGRAGGGALAIAVGGGYLLGVDRSRESPDMAKADPLTEILDALADATDGPRLTLGQLVDALGPRGFGPLFVVAAILVMLPTGAIPGMPLLVGIVLILLAGQIMLGWRKPWLPARLARIGIDRSRLHHTLDHARPFARRIGRVMRPRLGTLVAGPVALRVTAAAVIVAALFMIPLGFIPLFPFVAGLPVLLLGIGLTAQDGLFTGTGIAIVGGVVTAVLLRVT